LPTIYGRCFGAPEKARLEMHGTKMTEKVAKNNGDWKMTEWKTVENDEK